ncbi:ABC transporter [Aminobacter sp. Y103A]|jgi:branched-chain amino acid transport system ATP-binding protein|uniref:Branched-chain amino acid ABC transporter ATP-binding protein n=2 Tax=Aminobacter aminovorans TaxID=83263 RepID=A0AAC8YKT6_AMIAI|nr:MULTISPECIES: ATP-binding cassette domain-containing protein [Aminobacter]AMS40265.1 Branched-chain amino acid ABC transporter ATP-binding protein [Aminobacter aminovorans]MRX35235.1 ATP-binding cassette domain-containing protein [Aminobacter sp. MDW-2]WMC96545.1 ATP-binding cassette domain-containing protein [Aminobacter aminovorans]BBD40135.1 ABC transporter [Aminobacter sp. SS-2016]
MNASASMSKPILQVEHLSMKFGGLVAIGDLSFEAKRGEITALIGPNGAGKTTVFNCITGFYKPTEGMIRFNGREGGEFLLERMPDFQITAKAKVARTFQNIRLFSGMTLLENLLVAQHNKLMKASGFTVMGLVGLGGYRRASAESVELAKHWLEKAELLDRADDPAGDLPYGAQRRLEIARAMCTGPELLCLDEPAAGLNPKESLALNTLLNDIKDNTGTSILLIEHDMSVVMQISDHVVVLEYGRKISDGDPMSVRTDPKVIAAYLGVDDEEVSNVLVEVGDEQVIEELEGMPDPAHGPGSSSSMMAGPVSDTIGHSDDHGEVVSVSKGASKASQVEVQAARAAAASASQMAPAGKATKAKPAAAPAAGLMSAPVKPAPKAAAGKASAAVAAKLAAKAETKPAARASRPAVVKEAVKPAAKAAPAPAKQVARGDAPKAAAKTTTKAPAKAAPAAKPAAVSAKPVAKATNAAKPTSTATPPAKPAARATPAANPATKTAKVVKSAVTATPAPKGSAKPAPAAKPAVAKAETKTPAKPSSTAATKAPAKPAAKAAAKPAAKPAASTPKPTAAKPAASKPAAAKPSAPKTISNVLAAPRGGVADRLIAIKGIGPVNEKKLNEHGIFHFDQVAAWKKSDIAAAEAYLAFDGRIEREDWVGQAKALAREAAKPAKAKRGGGK